jgi:predicted chitinase
MVMKHLVKVFLFRGRGALQLTGKISINCLSDYIGVDCVKSELVAGKYYFESAKFYFDTNKLWTMSKSIC